MKASALLLSSLALTLTVACHGTSGVSSTETAPQGAMSYRAYDDAGRLVVRGWLRLDMSGADAAPNAVVTGDWELHAVVDPESAGGQDGHGPLEGDLQDGHLVVALYPGVVDGGCFLSGELTIDGPGRAIAYAGTWNDQSLGGPRHHGTFHAQE